MLFFDVKKVHAAPFGVAATPTRIFVIGAIRALENRSATHTETVLADIAHLIDCDPAALSFLIAESLTETDADMAVPDFRALLSKASKTS